VLGAGASREASKGHSCRTQERVRAQARLSVFSPNKSKGEQ